MEDKKFTIEMDTCLDVFEHGDGNIVIDRDGLYDEQFFLDMLRKNKISYEVIEMVGPSGWPIIEYTGTKEQLIPLLSLMSTSGQSEEEVRDILEDWDGDEETILEIIA